MRDKIQTHKDSRLNDDFSDTVQGEELEFRKSIKNNFPISHRISLFDNYGTPKLLSGLSANQLVMLSGAASGFLAGVVVCPLDVIKTRAQASGKPNTNHIQTFKDIVRNEGVSGLYRGIVPITIGYLPTWAIYFTVYERAKRFYPGFLKRNCNIDNGSIYHFCSAVTAGLMSSIAVNPIWVIKTRLMIQSVKTESGTNQFDRTYYNGTIDAFRKMYKEEGIRVFYKGLIPTLFGLIHVGIHFPVYEKLKQVLHCDTDNDNLTDLRQRRILIRLLIASSLSKMTASTITYPHEILRTRQQMQYPSKIGGVDRNSGIIDLCKGIYHKEGLRGFYIGYGVNLMRTIPASAVTLVSFEYFKTYLLELSGHSTRI